MQFLTDFADQAVVLPTVLAVSLTLALVGWGRGAVATVLGVGATLAAVLMIKLALYACGHLLPSWALSLRSASGHTAAAVVLYGGLIALCGRRGPGSGEAGLSAVGFAAVVAAAALVGGSRLALGVHTPADVAAGAAMGALGALLLVRLAGPRPRALRRWPVAVVAAVTLAALHGLHLPAEAVIRQAAGLYGACRAA